MTVNPKHNNPALSMHDNVFKNHNGESKKNGHPYPGAEPEASYEVEPYEDDSSTFLTDEVDHLILMHRDAHFGGDFGVMLSYYENENHIGIHPDIDIERILYLMEVEKEMDLDLAAIMLTGAEAEAVGRARTAYAQFKEIYEIDDETHPFPRLIADLVLAEEEEPIQEIEAVVSQGTKIVPDLISLLQADMLYDPLFPGYGFAPYLAIVCLGKIGDPRAITPIFETLSKEIVFDEMVVIDAFEEIGEPAKTFLLKVLKSRPLTQDNPNAAFALLAFSQDTDVAVAAFEELQDLAVQEKPLLRSYLLCNCEPLNAPPYKETFIAMAHNPNTQPELRAEMLKIIEDWENPTS